MNISSVVSLTLSLEQVGNNATNSKENSDTKESDLQSLDLFYQPTRHGSWNGRKVTKSSQGNQETYTTKGNQGNQGNPYILFTILNPESTATGATRATSATKENHENMPYN